MRSLVSEKKKPAETPTQTEKILRKKKVTGLSEEVQMKIRKIIYDFPKTEKRLMTVDALKEKLKSDPEINFQGSYSSMLRIVRSLGFKHKKSKNDRTVIIERLELRAKRIKFINQVRKWRSEGRPIIYLDETYIHQNLSTAKRWDDDTLEAQKNPISSGSRYIIVNAGY